MRRTAWKIMVVLVLLLAGCATREDGTGSEGHAGPTIAEDETTYSNPQEETTVLKDEGNLKPPPDSTLSYGGREVEGTLGSFCWTWGCADTFRIVVPRKQQTLTVPSDSETVFHYGGQSPLRTVEATAYRLNKKGHPMPRSHRGLKAHGSGVEWTIPVGLPPGEYVMDVFITVRQGDATYYFRIMVE